MSKIVPNEKIPFTKVCLTGTELPYLKESLESGDIQGDGPMTKASQMLLEKLTLSYRCLLTSSGTDALELSILLADIQPGDEVIMPSFTFVSSANAVVLRGGVPVFVDIRPDTLNLDERLIEAAITKRTKAIMPVHYAGIACDMEPILAIAKRHKLIVIEDAAHGAGAYWKGKHLGSIGELGMLSFHQTKNIAAGEGGALLVNSSEFAERAEIQREKGTNRKKFLRGEIDKYTWVEVGSSYLASDLTAAVLRAQLEGLANINKRRVKLFETYMKSFEQLAKNESVTLPTIPAYATGNGHKFFILTRSKDERPKLRDHLAKLNIQAVSHYEPLHLAPAGIKYGRCSGDLKVTESSASRILRLPLYADLTPVDQNRVIEAVELFYKS